MERKNRGVANRNQASMVIPMAGCIGLCLVTAVLASCFPGCGAGGTPENPVFPLMSGCPSTILDPETQVTLSISTSDGSLLGVAPVTLVNATIVSTRVGPSEFSVVVTPIESGHVSVTMEADSDIQFMSTRLACEFDVALGACCDGSFCEEVTVERCDTLGRTHKGPGTTCTPNFCVGACCGVPVNGIVSCIEAPESSCADQGGGFQGDGTTCDGECLCESAADCPEGTEVCMLPVCDGGVCGLRSACAGGTPCLDNGQCPINITSVVFPSTLQNGESGDLTIEWESNSASFRKTGQFFAPSGGCPEGFACAQKTLTLEQASPFVIPNAFTCFTRESTTPVLFTYEAILTDSNGVGSNRFAVTISCMP